jgi:hypothetical protein
MNGMYFQVFGVPSMQNITLFSAAGGVMRDKIHFVPLQTDRR